MKGCRFCKPVWVVEEHVHQHKHQSAARHDCRADCHLVFRLPGNRDRRRVEPQRFLEDLCSVCQRPSAFHREKTAACNRPDFRTQPCLHGCVLCQEIRRPTERLYASLCRRAWRHVPDWRLFQQSDTGSGFPQGSDSKIKILQGMSCCRQDDCLLCLRSRAAFLGMAGGSVS